jgi:hypothetical protein
MIVQAKKVRAVTYTIILEPPIAKTGKDKDKDNTPKIGHTALMKVLHHLGERPSKAEVNLMIWVRLVP